MNTLFARNDQLVIKGIQTVNYLAFENKTNEVNLMEAIRKSDLFIQNAHSWQ